MFGFGDVATYLKVTQLQLQFKDNNAAIFGVLFGKIPHPTIAPMSPPTSPRPRRSSRASAATK